MHFIPLTALEQAIGSKEQFVSPSPRGTSGERAGERGIPHKTASSPGLRTPTALVVGGDGVQVFEGYRSGGALVHKGRIGNKFNTGGDHDAYTILRGFDGWLYLMAGNGAGIEDRKHITEDTSPVLFEREASVSPNARDSLIALYQKNNNPDARAKIVSALLVSRMAERRSLFYAIDRTLVALSSQNPPGHKPEPEPGERLEESTRSEAIAFWKDWYERRSARVPRSRHWFDGINSSRNEEMNNAWHSPPGEIPFDTLCFASTIGLKPKPDFL